MSDDTVKTMNSLQKARENKVVKSSEMVQKGKFYLSLMESKALNYLVSKIKPGDDINTEYCFNCNDFQSIIHSSIVSEKNSYTNTKSTLQSISDKGWWIRLEDGKEAYVHWLNVIHLDPGTGDVIIKFHEDMFPYLYNLSTGDKKYYIAPRLEETSLMTHKYSPRIYELIRTYLNKKEWTFELGTGTDNDFQMMICDWKSDEKKKGKNFASIPKNWANFPIFERDVLAPAQEEINKYTDLKIKYIPIREDRYGKRYRKPVQIKFCILRKTEGELKDTKIILDDEYSVYQDAIKEKEKGPHQMTFEELESEKFFEEDRKKREEEQKEKDTLREKEKQDVIDKSVCPMVMELLYDVLEIDEIMNIFFEASKHIMPGQVKYDKRDAWCYDYVMHYYQYIKETPEDTKTTLYKRLLTSVIHDYDDFASQITQWNKVRSNV